ncbi:MAG: 50S ribosomal protein L9 [Gaiellales bacterium]|jgi:large subunit ribosomal protein L9|nr:50S ribosomal protein L9 [Gaiellales bacterium]
MARTGNRKAILLDDVEHLGHRGDIVAVSRGYLRNYLVPRKLAEEATTARVAEVEKLVATRAAQEARTAEQAQTISATLTKTVLTIPMRSGPDGRLYGSVTAADLADEIWRTRKIRVDRRKIRLEEPIKAVGAYLVEIDVFTDVRAAVKTQVVAAEGFEMDEAPVAEVEAEAVEVVEAPAADDVAAETDE